MELFAPEREILSTLWGSLKRMRLTSGNDPTRWHSLFATLLLTRGQLQQHRSGSWGLLRLWLFFAGGLLFTLASLYSAWRDSHSTDWEWYWYWLGVLYVTLNSGFLTLALFLSLRSRLRHSANQDIVLRREAEAITLREAAASGDEDVAPRSPWQPAVLAASAVQMPTTVGDLYQPDALITFWVSDALIPIPLLLWGAILLLTDTRYLWQAWVVGPILLARGLVIGIRLALRLRPFRVRVSEQGLEWRRGRRRHVIGWGSLRSLSYIETPAWGIERPPGRVYMIDGGNSILMWLPSRKGWHLLRNHGADASWLLCRLVVTHTGLTLRDLTSAAVKWTSWRPARQRAAEQGRRSSSGSGEHARAHHALAFLAVSVWSLLVMTLILAGIVVLMFHPPAPPLPIPLPPLQ